MRDQTQKDYNQNLTLHEITSTFAKLKCTSHGHDLVHNLMLKNMPSTYIQRSLMIINSSFNETKVSDTWKKAVIISIHKHGKPTDTCSSYRLISLLQCFPKLMEKLIKQRLHFFIESDDILSPSQAGFRQRLSTPDQLVRLETCITNSMARTQTCIVIFFELKEAYDQVWYN